ncbi:glutamate receptor ionotropic, delta-2 isoform X2 [Maniola jurtina]|uniref:glutamate receptor ionotropic, delta-2 isoform X2 n=1 Tax=Maniola jurtina TaxID=191418 RepID=UPI001E68DD3C|nr:glutamate receptor ionotropic, delta-2 isoform X2 [Maniola jurtina]
MTGVELILSTLCNASVCDYGSSLDELTARQNEIQELKNAINGKHLKIGTYNNYPLSWAEGSENGTLDGRGVAFILVNILRQRFNFTFEVVVPERNFELGGRRPEDSLIGLVNSSKVDMAAAFIPILVQYNKFVTFSNDLDEGVWMMMLKRPKESAAGSGLLAPFATYVWYLILAAVLVYGPCITLLTWIRSKLIRDHEQPISLSPSVWFVYGAFIKQGTTLAPEANTTRVLFATWWLFVILLSAFYTANLTAFLTLSKFTLDIENPEDLYKKNYRWVASEGGTVQYVIKNPDEDLYYLSRMLTNGRAQFRSPVDDQEFLPMVSGGAVLVKEQTGIEQLMYADYLQKAREGVEETERCTYVVAPNAFMKRRRAFAYPNNSTLKILFDTVLSYLIQSGIVRFLEHRDLPSTKICPLDLQSKDRQLRNSDLMMTYLIMVTGLAAAIAVFLGEVIFKRYIKVDAKLEDKGKKTKKRKNKNVKPKSYDSSRPPPYDSLFGNPRNRYKFNEESKKEIINGREYYVVNNVTGDVRLIPVRTPSAFLYR